MRSSIKSLCAAMLTGIFVFVAQPATADVQQMKFEVVGTWGFLENWQHHQ